jgi:hypothetical protein
MRPLLFLGILAATATGCVAYTYFPDPRAGTKVQVTVKSEEPGPVLVQRTGVRIVTSPTALVKERRRVYAVYAPLCAAPCSVDLDPVSPLYVNGDGITPSRLFALDPKEGPVTVDVRPGSFAQTVVGLVGVMGGFAAFGTGSFLAFGGALTEQRAWIVPGVVTLGVGVGSMIVGAILLATGATNVRVSPARAEAHVTPGRPPW